MGAVVLTLGQRRGRPSGDGSASLGEGSSRSRTLAGAAAAGLVLAGFAGSAHAGSGATTGGAPDDTNTRYAQVGLDQTPTDRNSQGTPTELSLCYAGSSGSPHAGCVAVNTDGSGGQPAPAGTSARPAGQSDSNTTCGCGSNTGGAGPAGDPGWPTPGAYVGTCGVYVGSPGTTGQVPGFAGQSVGSQQLTNAAGQVAVDPNPSAC